MRVITLVTIISFIAITGLAVLIFHYAMSPVMSMDEEQCLMHCLSSGDIQIIASSIITAFIIALAVLLRTTVLPVLHFAGGVAIVNKIFHPPPSVVGSTVLLE